MSKLIIIRGNSGSGKTTLAKEIHQRLPRNTLLISQDTVRRDMLRVKDGENTLGLPLFEDLLHLDKQRSYLVRKFLHIILIFLLRKP